MNRDKLKSLTLGIGVFVLGYFVGLSRGAQMPRHLITPMSETILAIYDTKTQQIELLNLAAGSTGRYDLVSRRFIPRENEVKP